MPDCRFGPIAVVALALGLAGCSSGRFMPAYSSPPPLTPAPSGTVSANELPPPSTAGEFPDAPGQNQQDFAALDPTAAETATPVTAGSIAGVWNVTVDGQGCRVATPQTTFGQGYRAGPLRCPTPMSDVRSWNVSGNQLAFYDENGDVLARLYSSGQERFSGQTSNGMPVTLSR